MAKKKQQQQKKRTLSQRVAWAVWGSDHYCDTYKELVAANPCPKALWKEASIEQRKLIMDALGVGADARDRLRCAERRFESIERLKAFAERVEFSNIYDECQELRTLLFGDLSNAQEAVRRVSWAEVRSALLCKVKGRISHLSRRSKPKGRYVTRLKKVYEAVNRLK